MFRLDPPSSTQDRSTIPTQDQAMDDRSRYRRALTALKALSTASYSILMSDHNNGEITVNLISTCNLSFTNLNAAFDNYDKDTPDLKKIRLMRRCFNAYTKNLDMESLAKVNTLCTGLISIFNGIVNELSIALGESSTQTASRLTLADLDRQSLEQRRRINTYFPRPPGMPTQTPESSIPVLLTRRSRLIRPRPDETDNSSDDESLVLRHRARPRLS